MSVRQRKWSGGSSWQVDVIAVNPAGNEMRVRRSVPATSKEMAKQMESQIRAAIVEGRPLPTFDEKGRVEPTQKEQPMTFAQWATVYEARHERKPATQVKKERQLRNHLIPQFGAMPIAEITSGKIDSWANSRLTAGAKATTVDTSLQTLQACLSLAYKEGRLEKPIKVRRLVGEKYRTERRWLRADEQRKLVLACDPEWRPMVILALTSGMRISEILVLHWSSVDLKKGTITIRHNLSEGELVDTPKEGRITKLPLASEAVEALKGLPRNGLLVFANPDGSRRTYGQAHKALSDAAERAGIEGLGGQWHSLKHSFGTAVLKASGNPETTRRLLRHSSLAITSIYVHADDEEMTEALGKLPSVTAQPAAHADVLNADSLQSKGDQKMQ